MSQIQILRKAHETAYVETREEVSESELEKLLKKPNVAAMEQSIAADLPYIWVRCNRSLGQWVIVNDAGYELERIDCGVLMNVTFSIETKTRFGRGCSGIWAEYVGVAIGQRMPANTPITALNKLINKLRFDDEDGCFRCRVDGSRVESAAFLILKENCGSEYIALPPAEKEN